MFVSLRSCSDQELLSRTRALASRERALTLQVLLHLIEIERRRLHLEQAYRSMFDYCTRDLGYSASAAMRRIRAARCVARFPEVYGMLAANEVNVSTIAQVSRVLRDDNKAELLPRIRGRSQREVEAVVAEYEPRDAMPRDRVRTVVVRVPASTCVSSGERPGTQSANSLAGESTLTDERQHGATGTAAAPAGTPMDMSADSPAPGDSTQAHNRNGCECKDSWVAGPETRVERRTMFQFAASEAFTGRLGRFRSLVWHRLPANAGLEQLLALALEIAIDREDPAARERRRAARRAGTTSRPQDAAGPPRDPRRIPAAVRDRVFVRDEGRCAYAAPDGRRCGSTQALQIDHVVPVARGGGASPANLRLLCAYHNRIEARRILGTATPAPRDRRPT